MKTARHLIGNIGLVMILVLGLISTMAAQAQEKDKACLECHTGFAKKKVVHAALEKGCVYCHSEIGSGAVPHQIKDKTAKARAAGNSAMCDECHEKKMFEGKWVHGPITAGACFDCHDSHASDHPGLLKKEPATLCLDCHPEIKKGPHVVAGFSRSGHPLGNEAKEAKDPLRIGKKFYCVSCHEPHSSQLPKLNRFALGMVSCQKCHKM
jgi:predicted CXXCH cytochrome family protein